MLAHRYEAYQLDELTLAVTFFSFAGCFCLGGRTATLRSAVEQSQLRERQAWELARTDDLTGLPNRRALIEELDQERDWNALLLIDLNGFKRINDTLGHQKGDQVLAEIGRRLMAIKEAGLVRFVARVGGDEFVCLATGRGNVASAAVRNAVAQSIFLNPEVVRLTPAIGVVSRNIAASTDKILRQADEAMYSAKRLDADARQPGSSAAARAAAA